MNKHRRTYDHTVPILRIDASVWVWALIRPKIHGWLTPNYLNSRPGGRYAG